MSKLDDILKKSISGKTSDTYVRSGEIDTILEKSRRGTEAAVFNSGINNRIIEPVSKLNEFGLPRSELRAAPIDTRPVDKPVNKLLRAVLPSSLEKRFGIDESQVQAAPMSEYDRIQMIGNAQTIQMAKDNPELVGYEQYLKSGLSFGNNLSAWFPGYKNDIAPADLPEPTTTKQKVAYGIGNIITMSLAQPLIEEAFVGLALKIPGGASLISKAKEAAQLSPWKVGYPLAITKAGIEGGLFGLITENKQTVAQNVLQTAGTFAAFSALAFPVMQFFKPILEKVGTMNIPNNSKTLVNDAIKSMEGQGVSKTVWFKNPNDPTQLLKITGNGIESIKKNAAGIVESGTYVKDVPVLTSIDIEAFKQNPSIYNKLKDWLGGKLKPGETIPFTGTPPIKTTTEIVPVENPPIVPTETPVTPPTVVVPKIPLEQIKYKVEKILPKLENAIVTGDEHLIETTRNLVQESGDTALINQVEETIKNAQITANKIVEQNQKITNIIEQSVQTPEKQLTQPEFTPYKSNRKPTINSVYGNTPSDKFIVGTYDGKPYTTNAYILEFNSDVTPPAKALLFNEEVGANKVPDETAIEKLIPKETAPVELVKVYGEEGGKMELATLKGDNGSINIQRKYYDYFNNKYKNPQFFAGKQGPILVMKGDQKVGLIMPMANDISIKKPVTVWEKPVTAQPELKQPEIIEKKTKEKAIIPNADKPLSKEELEALPKEDRKDYELYLKDKIEALPKLKEGEITVIFGGSGKNGQYVDTNIQIALNRGVNADTNVINILESNLKMPNAERAERGERIIDRKDIKTADEIIDYVNELDLSVENPDFYGEEAGILPFTKKRIKESKNYELKTLKIDDLIKNDLDLKDYVDANNQRYEGERDFFNLETPIVVGKNGEVIDGMNRILTLKNNGVKEIKAYVPSKIEIKKQVAESLSDEGLGSPVGNKTIRRKVEEQNYKLNMGEVQEVPEDFKISQRAKDILAEFGVVINEKQVPNKYLGFYKYITKKVRVQALYDVTTVTHEAVHAIDAQISFSKKLIEDSGRGADVRKQLTDIYEDIYPGAKREHPLDKRIKEGLAVLFENYFYDPASISAEYPDLVNSFIKPEGKYYDPLFSKLLDRMNQLVDDYARLTPEQRIGSRIRTGKEVVENDTGFTWKQRLEFEIFNKYEPLKRYGKMAGVEWTWNDPLIQAFNMMNKNAIAASWVKGDITPVLMANGNFKLEKGTVKDYLEIIKKLDLFDEGQPIPKEAADTMTGAKGVFKAAVKKISDVHGYSPFKEYNLKTYRSYLVARRVVADNNKLRMLENTARELDEFIKTLMGEDFANAAGDIEELKTLKAEIAKLKEIIARDDFSLQDASAVVEKYADKFKEADAIYDGINRKMIEMAVQNELIPQATADEMIAEKGYTSFRRYIDEDLNAVGTIRTSSKSKVSAFKERSGSQLDIVDPIYSQMQSINEIIGKSMENRLWLKVADLTRGNPDIARRFEKIAAVPSIAEDGTISYPQEKQEGVIRVFRNGKREFYKVGAEFQAVAKTMRPKELDLFSKIIRIPSSLFTRLTTSANPLFAVGNLSVDQFSALSQTKTGFVPVVDPAKSFVEYVKGTDGINAYIALGGKRQTLASFYDLSPEQIEHKLTGGLSTYEKAAGIVDYGISILEMPSNTSEIMTRYSEFKRAKDQGDSDSVAMYKASEVTTPFQLMGNLGGRFGQAYIKSIPYLNAQLQVLYKWGRASKDNPKRMGTVMAGLLTAGLTAAILTMKYGTEEQKRAIGEQPVRNMSRYIYIPAPNGKDLIKFRIPEIMGVFTGMGYLYTIQHYGGNKATFDDYETVVSSALPEQIQFWNPTKMVVSMLPQAIKPGVQVAFNTKVFPELAPIVPEYMLNKKPSEQYNSYSSKISKVFGDMFGLSPIKSEFLLRNQFGVVGGLLVGKFPGNPLYIQEEKYVMAGRAYNRFYDNKDLVTQTYQDVVKDNPDKYSYEDKYAASQEYKVHNKVADILADMRKIGEDKLTDETKNWAYDTLIKLNEAKTMDEVIPDLYKWRELVDKNANVK